MTVSGRVTTLMPSSIAPHHGAGRDASGMNLLSTLVDSQFLGRGPELSVIVPTFNEARNIPMLIERLRTALDGISWELIVVDDDSPDRTSDLAKRLAQSDPRIRCIRRLGRRGLAGACIEGMLSSSSRYVAVIDGDLQHDETILPNMLGMLRSGACDLVVGTRHAEGGSNKTMGRLRQSLSASGRVLSRAVLRTATSDPMSGFFMTQRMIVEDLAPRLSTEGFKILADILALNDVSLRIGEVAYEFRPRHKGVSKLSGLVLIDYIGFLVHHMTRGLLPSRFVLFGLVGTLGLLVHLTVLRAVLAIEPEAEFAVAEAMATFAAMLSNFLLNNWLTYGDRRHRGLSMIPAFGLFSAACSVGLLSNVGIASWIYAGHPIWWVAGLSGAVVGAVWNYVVSTSFVWRCQSASAATPST